MANLFDIYKTFEHGFPGVNSQLKYPLENQDDYLGKITFTPVDEKEVNMLDLTPTLDDVMATVKTFGKFTGDVINDLFTAGQESDAPDAVASDATTRVDRVISEASEGAKEGFYGKVEPAPAFSERDLKLNTSKRISLYLPRAIQIQDTVTYDNQFQLGLIGGAIEAGLASGSGAVGSAVGAIAGEAAGLGKTFMGNREGMSKEAAGILSGKIAARIPVVGDAAGGAVRSASRLTTNPNTRAIFKDVPIRNFSFAFQLIPTSQNEAIAIEEIIKTFRSELYPVSLRTAGVNVGYKFPNRFLIKVKYNNRDIKGIRFLPVYMQSFNATYNSATGGMHSDGRFSAVDISMAFTETRAIAKQDIEAGY